MITTLREYWLILVLIVALAVTIGVSYGKLLTELTEHTVAQMEVRR